MKKFWSVNKNVIKNIAGLLAFLLLLAVIFSRLTYLFRVADFQRDNLLGFKSESEKVDVAYIGGSATYVYWEPLKAYADCGFTSYNVATSGIGVENILSYIKYAEKYQNPDLYIVGIRAFEYYSDIPNEAGLRKGSDNMDITFGPRYELINDFFQNRDIDENEDISSYYFDIAKYHSNTDSLKDKDTWKYLNNKGNSQFKGFATPEKWRYLCEPVSFQTDERAELLPGAQKELDKIISYCDKKKLNVLFVVCPYVITKDHYAIYNTIADEVIAHGYGYLNANDYLSEIGIDFAKDFYNIYHVNIYGAEKYTEFLEHYIVNKYDLPDHRNDDNYFEWNESVTQFEDYCHFVKNEVIEVMIKEAKRAVDQGDKIREMTSFVEWSNYVKDHQYSLFVVGDGEALSTASGVDSRCLENLGIELIELQDSKQYLNVISDMFDSNDFLLSKEDERLVVTNDVYPPFGEIIVSDVGDERSVVIAGEEYSRKDKDGLNIVVFANYYRTVIDSVTLKLVDGEITIER